MNRIQISNLEQARLDRILAVPDLEKERKIAYPFFVLSVVGLVVGAVFVVKGLQSGFLFFPTAMLCSTIGLARLGYYKAFRLIHDQAQLLEAARSRVDGQHGVLRPEDESV